VHFNALSGLDRWGGIGGMIILGRTLPAPNAVELLAKALTGRQPMPNPKTPAGGIRWVSGASGWQVIGQRPWRAMVEFG